MKVSAVNWPWHYLSSAHFFQVHRMDAHGLGLATAGALIGWWANQKDPPKDPGACQCHCSCLGPDREPSLFPWWGICTLILGLIVIIAGLILALVWKRPEGVESVNFPFKGGYGKGKYGAERGLQILN